MSGFSKFLGAFNLWAMVLPVLAGPGGKTVSPPEVTPSASPPANLFTGEGVSLGKVLFPHLHFNSVYGRTSSKLGHELGGGHHDPVANGWTLQGFEAGLSLRASEYIEGFTTYHGFWENEDPHDYDGKFEEWFGKIRNLPGGIELRGGRYLNRFGIHNAVHIHGWDWVDNSLVFGRFLGDDGQYSIGGEVAWTMPLPWISVLSLSAGEAQTEAHEPEEEAAAGEDAEPEFEGEGALFADTLVTADWTNLANYSDFHQFRFGLSGAWGNNAWGSSTQIYGLHGQYQWRENGLEAGGDYLRWRTEVLVRRVDALTGHLPGEEPEEEEAAGEEAHADGQPGSFNDWGLTSSVVYGLGLGSAGVLEAGLRYEFLQGVGNAALSERHRLSPGLTYFVNRQRTAFLRSQYNWDRIDGETENSVWFGLGLNWGGPEVR